MQAKTFKTSRSLTYSYLYTSPSNPWLPTLLFIHGFPSTHRDWDAQTSFFASKGYGIVCPDMLGYGQTDKPDDPSLYIHKSLADDLMEVLESEKVGDAIVIGHDWGSATASRLVTYHEDRFLGFAFTAVPFNPPRPVPPLDIMLGHLKKTVGSELFGYWKFLSIDGVEKTLLENVEGFAHLLFPDDPTLWREYVAPVGGMDRWLQEKKQCALPSYMSQASFDAKVAELVEGGMYASLNYYRIVAQGLENDDNAAVRDRTKLSKPSFFAAALQDYVCIPEIGKESFKNNAVDATIVDFDTDHWIQLAQPARFNEELEKWISEKVLNTRKAQL
ncbi:Soluble epoxide hydrolase [Phaffia rhodozyma]|uniref:Soluble epoxide hydrolase n=1 Tax=Phaffia rhodozyma TaxID=264483 RepID=A0A0F7SPE2_PHARH|nr:Soluble epoxide hydrolase [Phaffia rhodozyma]